MSDSPPATTQTPSSTIPETLIAELDGAPSFETIVTVDGTPYRLGWGQTTWPDSVVPLYTTEDVEPRQTDFAGILVYGTQGARGNRQGYAHFTQHDPDDPPQTSPTSFQENPVGSLTISDTESLDALDEALETIHELTPSGKRPLPEYLAFARHLNEARTEHDRPVHEGILGAEKIEKSLFEWKEPAHQFLFRVETAIDDSDPRAWDSGFHGLPAVSLWAMAEAVISFADRLSTEGSDLQAYYAAKDTPRNR